jgi:hypothetical protein
MERLKQEAFGPSEYEKMETLTPTTSQEKEAKEKYLATHDKKIEQKNQLIKQEAFKSKKEEFDLKKIYSNIPGFDNKSLSMNKKLKLVFPKFNRIIDSLGVEQALVWLYQQQALAGNVVFCNPSTGIPFNFGQTNADKANYLNTVTAFLNDFGFTVVSSRLPDAKELKTNPKNYVESHFKSSFDPNRDYSGYQKLALSILNEISNQNFNTNNPTINLKNN